ncbi:putative DUF742 family protein [Actinoalloteichus sp. GBA129-24]|uniref:DUF742 family protein n=1 Tax=Actinoalloteichus fjordicus TaxID=1612552 RepID=A0AAC9LD67_9PSEU|nr:putative DUF742 family protein [Actinoalloteichus fjordicus]APU20638.1 putative DUF742 family protein [Actinoalloteichus sp. GBA129-24]
MVGLTGARFGPSTRRRARHDTPKPNEGATASTSDSVTGTSRASVGSTGARFGGAARRRRDRDDDTSPAETVQAENAVHIDFDQTRSSRPVPWNDPLDEVGEEFEEDPIWPPSVGEPGTWLEASFTGSLVRPYARTGGRTSVAVDLAMETLISSSTGPVSITTAARPELRRITEICVEPRSLAEVSALLALPIGVTRVLIADLAESGGVQVHQPIDPRRLVMNGDFLQRVLTGLRRL